MLTNYNNYTILKDMLIYDDWTIYDVIKEHNINKNQYTYKQWNPDDDNALLKYYQKFSFLQEPYSYIAELLGKNTNDVKNRLEHLLTTHPPEVQSNSFRPPPEVTTIDPTRRGGSPPEVSPAVSSSNYLSLKSRATPGDRGGREGSSGPQVETSSGRPESDLRELEGEVNRRADGRNVTSGGTSSGKTSGGVDDTSVKFVRLMKRYMLELSRNYSDEYDLVMNELYENIMEAIEMKKLGGTDVVCEIIEPLMASQSLLNSNEFNGLLKCLSIRSWILPNNYNNILPLLNILKNPSNLIVDDDIKNIPIFNVNDNDIIMGDSGGKKHYNAPPEVTFNSPHPAVSSPLEVTTSVPLGVEPSSNYLPVNGNATPGDRGGEGSEEGSDGSSIMGMMEDGAKDVLDVTSSGGGLPGADLREAEGEVNKESRLQDKGRTSSGTASGKEEHMILDRFSGFDMKIRSGNVTSRDIANILIMILEYDENIVEILLNMLNESLKLLDTCKLLDKVETVFNNIPTGNILIGIKQLFKMLNIIIKPPLIIYKSNNNHTITKDRLHVTINLLKLSKNRLEHIAHPNNINTSHPPEVTTTVGLADSSSNYLSLKSRATPGDRGGREGSDEGSDGSSIMGMMEDGAKDMLDVTSSGEPAADLREAEGEINKRADGRTRPQVESRLQDKGTTSGVESDGRNITLGVRSVRVIENDDEGEAIYEMDEGIVSLNTLYRLYKRTLNYRGKRLDPLLYYVYKLLNNNDLNINISYIMSIGINEGIIKNYDNTLNNLKNLLKNIGGIEFIINNELYIKWDNNKLPLNF